MKTSHKIEEPTFPACSVTIELESEADLQALWVVLNTSSVYIKNAVAEHRHPFKTKHLRGALDEAWYQVNALAVELGLI